MPSLLSLLRGSSTLAHTQQIHAQILVHAQPLHNHLLSKLVDLRGSLDYALSVFLRISTPNDHSYNSIIRAYASSGPFHRSLFLYSHMLHNSISPTNFTYPFLLKACSALSDVNLGRQVHTHVLKFGFDSDLFVGNSLIDMYSKCFRIEEARQMFDGMPERDGVSWNSIVSGYALCGDMRKACELFEEMHTERNVVAWTALINGFGREGMIGEMLGFFRQMLVSADGVRPNSATMVCLLSACASVANCEVGRWLSSFIDVNGMAMDVILRTALIDMYSKCGDVGTARRVFEEISSKNLVSWNAMITGYVQCGFPDEAIQLFHRMRSVSIMPNEITMVNLLSACASLGGLELGREIHLYLARNKLELNVILVTALVDMYSKCGSIDDACLAFIKTSKKDVALWNSMILGLAVHGHGRDALAIFRSMERVGTRPNDITFLGVLSACSHSGLINEGKVNFEKLHNHGLKPRVEHYACMVDLLGRAGLLDEAVTLVRSMVVRPDSVIWGSLLSACRIHCNVELANEVGQIILSSDEPNLGCCVLLSNIYASVRRWADVARVRRLIKGKGIKKLSGCSWIEVDGYVHRFLVEDTVHVKYQEVYVMLRRLMKQLSIEGYEPDFEFVSENIDGL